MVGRRRRGDAAHRCAPRSVQMTQDSELKDKRTERRLAAIVLADVVGYSHLMGVDEVGTLARLNAHRQELIDPLIDRYHGRIVKLMGDGALLEFASVVDAVSCSVELQRGVAQRNTEQPQQPLIVFRLGINLGDVIVDGEDIYGDGVNIAARLEALAEPGGICVSGGVYDALGNKLPYGYEFLGEQRVKNIADPVRAYRLLNEAGDGRPRRSGPSGRRTLALATVAVGSAAIGAIAYWQLYAPAPTPAVEETTAISAKVRQPDGLSIAVLPFSNLSDDAKQEYFVDGLTEDLITDLAKLPDLFVVSRNSVFTFKGQAIKVRDFARELGVRYVLEGSVRRAADRIRINAQLIDAETDGHLWAERYDRVLDEVFEVQDEVKRQIVAALALELNTADAQKLARKPTENLEAYEYYLRGRRAMEIGTRRNIRLAYYALEKAIDLDPGFAEAYATLAMNYALDFGGNQYWDDWVEPPTVSRRKAIKLAGQATALDPTMALPELALAKVALAERNFEQALVHVNRAVDLEPGDSRVFEAQAKVLTARGRHQEALEAMQQALRLDPKPPARYYGTLGKIAFALGQYEQAVAYLEQAAEGEIAGYTWRNSYYLPAAYGHLGMADRARAYLAIDGNIWAPGFNLEGMRLHPFYEQVTDARRYQEGLKRAGVTQYADGFNPAEEAGRQVGSASLHTWLEGIDFVLTEREGRSLGTLTLRGGGTATLQYRPGVSETGAATVEADTLCLRFDALTRGRTACFRVFENTKPARSDLNESEYVMAGHKVWYLKQH